MKDLVRIFVPRFLIAVLMSIGLAVACSLALAEVCTEPPGSDAFTTPREALLREKPSPNARILGKLPQGYRLKLIEARERYLKVEASELPQGWVAREVVVLFAPGDAATQDMIVVGRSFGRTDANRRLAASILLRACARLREQKAPDPETEVLLGETAEGIAAAGAPFPPRASGSSRSPDLRRARALRRLRLPARDRDARQRHQPRAGADSRAGPGRSSPRAVIRSVRRPLPHFCRSRPPGSSSSRRPRMQSPRRLLRAGRHRSARAGPSVPGAREERRHRQAPRPPVCRGAARAHAVSRPAGGPAVDLARRGSRRHARQRDAGLPRRRASREGRGSAWRASTASSALCS